MDVLKAKMIVMGSKTELAEFFKVCSAIQSLGRQGASRDIKISVDGDGSGKLNFFFEDESLQLIQFPPIKDFNIDDPNKTIDLSIGE